MAFAGSTDKRTITATFTITLDSKFLPVQLIYGGKTTKSILPVSFPANFLATANEKHYSNEKESLELIKHAIIPHIEEERKVLNLSADHPALMIMDIFKG